MQPSMLPAPRSGAPVADRLVPTVRTRISVQPLYAVLRNAWRSQLGSEPARSALLVLLAQWSLETANGSASNNWNLAGIKYAPGCGSDYAQYLTREVVAGKPITVMQRFRAYDSLEDGAADYLRLLRTRFGAAWAFAVAGDVQAFAHALKLARYYTAPEDQYVAGLRSRYALLDQAIDEDTQPSTPTALATGRPAYVPPDDEGPGDPPDAA